MISRRRPLLRGFALNVGSVSLGTMIGQGILLAASPVLTRIYTPDELGSYSVVFGISTILATVFSLSLYLAIPVAKSDLEAVDLFWASSLASLLLALLTILAVGIAGTGETTFPLSGLQVLLAVAIASILAVWTGLRALSARMGQFPSIALSNGVDSLHQAIGQVGLGEAGFRAFGLGAGYGVGKIAAIVMLFRSLPGNFRWPRSPLNTAKCYLQYALWLTPNTLLNQASVTSISILIAVFFGEFLTGQYSLAVRTLAIPSALVGQAVSTVFYPRIARTVRANLPSARPMEQVSLALFFLTWPVFSLPLLLGPELFSMVFGRQWAPAGVAASILSPWLAINFVSSSISSFGVVMGKFRNLLGISVLESGLRFAALLTGYLLDMWILFLILYSVVGFFISVFYLAWMLRLSGSSLLEWRHRIPRSYSLFIVLVVVLFASKDLMSGVVFVVLSCVSSLYGLVVGARASLRLRS